MPLAADRDLSVVRHPSPNAGPRRGGALPDMVVLHYTAMDTAHAALDRLCDPLAEVSAHYLISRTGDCWCLVDEHQRAWHAGAGSWGGQTDVNSRSIGIELDNDGLSPFSDPLMRTLERLLPGILERWQIQAHRVIGHSDMAPDRKIDPGPRFDWRRLALQGLACWPFLGSVANDGAGLPKASTIATVPPDPAEPDQAAFLRALRGFGYPGDASPAALCAAFRARFRPGTFGPLDEVDLGLAEELARRFPVDPAGQAA